LTRGLDFSPDGKLLVTGDDFGTVTFWDVETNKPQFSEEAHTRPVGSVLFSRDGRMLATGSWDGSVRVWDVAEKKSLANYATGAIVFTMRFAADDRSLIVACTKEDSHEPDMFYFP
jgi:WD40 repeat protein